MIEEMADSGKQLLAVGQVPPTGSSTDPSNGVVTARS